MVDKNGSKEETVEPCKRGGFGSHNLDDTLFAEFLDEDMCRRWILERLHPSGAHCPDCNQPVKDETTLKNFWNDGRATCKGCGKWFTALTSTFLQSTRLSFKDILLLAFLAGFLDEGINIGVIAEKVDVSPETVRQWIGRLSIYK